MSNNKQESMAMNEEQVYTVTVTKYGTHHWRQNGKLHRLDGPAVIRTDGYEAWYQNGKLHRLDGPARIYSDASQEWYQNGKLHRLDGPAVYWPKDGYQEWHVDGVEFTKKQFERRDKFCSCTHKIITFENGQKYRLVSVEE